MIEFFVFTALVFAGFFFWKKVNESTAAAFIAVLLLVGLLFGWLAAGALLVTVTVVRMVREVLE